MVCANMQTRGRELSITLFTVGADQVESSNMPKVNNREWIIKLKSVSEDSALKNMLMSIAMESSQIVDVSPLFSLFGRIPLFRDWVVTFWFNRNKSFKPYIYDPFSWCQKVIEEFSELFSFFPHYFQLFNFYF
jgi:hypothetical protein